MECIFRYYISVEGEVMCREKEIQRRRTELGDICETHGLRTERARQHGARNKHLHLLLAVIKD